MIVFWHCFLMWNIHWKGTFSNVVRLQKTSIWPDFNRSLLVLQRCRGCWSLNLHKWAPCPTWSRENIWKSIVHREIRPSEKGCEIKIDELCQEFVDVCIIFSQEFTLSSLLSSAPLSIYSKYIQFLWECIGPVSIDITCSCPGHLFVALGWWAVFASCQSGLQRTSHRYLVGISTAAVKRFLGNFGWWAKLPISTKALCSALLLMR